MKNLRMNTALLLLLAVFGFCLPACDEQPDPNRDYVGEHCALYEQMLATKTELADVLREVDCRATADTVAPKVKELSKKIHRLSNQDAALSRAMGHEQWDCCMQHDKENRARGRKAHEDVLRQVFYLKNVSYYGSDLLLRALP